MNKKILCIVALSCAASSAWANPYGSVTVTRSQYDSNPDPVRFGVYFIKDNQYAWSSTCLKAGESYLFYKEAFPNRDGQQAAIVGHDCTNNRQIQEPSTDKSTPFTYHSNNQDIYYSFMCSMASSDAGGNLGDNCVTYQGSAKK